jgi:hypothetical protein
MGHIALAVAKDGQCQPRYRQRSFRLATIKGPFAGSFQIQGMIVENIECAMGSHW